MNKLLAVSVISFILLGGCTKPDETKAILEANGYRSVEIKGYGWLNCSEDDQYATKFTAISGSGNMVEGVVCSGVFKGSTIRITRVD